MTATLLYVVVLLLLYIIQIHYAGRLKIKCCMLNIYVMYVMF